MRDKYGCLFTYLEIYIYIIFNFVNDEKINNNFKI